MASDAAPPLFESTLTLPGLRRGKVRDVYDLPPDAHGPRLLIGASDRISAFDVVMPTPIPGKGRLLTQMSLFWLRMVERLGICRTHVLGEDVGEVPDAAFVRDGTTREQLAGRITIARAARVVPIECVARGYLEGSGWKEYQLTGKVCGIALPKGLRQGDRLPEPIFTPATKEQQGKHDENISFERAKDLAGAGVAQTLRDLTLRIYAAAARHAAERGIIIADTKFEFGFALRAGGTPDLAGGLMLVDEALTPDSSRFWPMDAYQPGRSQASFDKQFLREHLESLVEAGAWDKRAPGPALPPTIVERTLAKYREAMRLLAG